MLVDIGIAQRSKIGNKWLSDYLKKAKINIFWKFFFIPPAWLFGATIDSFRL